MSKVSKLFHLRSIFLNTEQLPKTNLWLLSQSRGTGVKYNPLHTVFKKSISYSMSFRQNH